MAPLTEISQLWPSLAWIAERVIGSGHYYVLWLLALLYCLLRKGDKPDLRTAAWPLLILFILISCPPVAWLLLTKIFSQPYYPRFVWVLMVEIILACVGTDIVRRQKGKWRKRSVLFAILVLIAVSGRFLFAGNVQLAGNMQFDGDFYHSSNRFKLKNETIAIADYLKENHIGEWGYFTEAINIEIRQYDAGILMVSGRDSGQQLEYALESPQWQVVATKLLDDWKNISVLVMQYSKDHERKLEQIGWIIEKRINSYAIYCRINK